jgi:putative tricarboxylic transport membrane protein
MNSRREPAALSWVAMMLAAGPALVAAAPFAHTERVTLMTHSSPGTGNELMLREIADIWNKNKMVPKQAAVESVTGSQGEKARRTLITQNRGNVHLLAAFTPPSLNVPILLRSTATSWRNVTPIAILAVDPLVLVVNAEGPYKSLRDLVEAAKQKPKSILQAGGSYGNSASMAGKLLEDHAKVSFSYTPFKGGGEAIIQLLGNHVHFIIENPGEVLQHVKAGKLRVLAGSDKLEVLPGVPTLAEAGYPFRQLKQFRAVVAPPGIPPEATAHWMQLLSRTRETQQWKAYLAKTGLIENWVSGGEFAAFLEQEEKEYTRLNEAMGLMK